MLSKEILEKGQNEFFLQNSFSYSADVKPVINKNQLNLSSKHKYMLSLCIYCDLYAESSITEGFFFPLNGIKGDDGPTTTLRFFAQIFFDQILTPK